MKAPVLELHDPEQEQGEKAERERLVADGCENEKGARAAFGNCSRSTLYEYTERFRMRTVKLPGKGKGGRRLWPRSELRRVQAEYLENPD